MTIAQTFKKCLGYFCKIIFAKNFQKSPNLLVRCRTHLTKSSVVGQYKLKRSVKQNSLAYSCMGKQPRVNPYYYLSLSQAERNL